MLTNFDLVTNYTALAILIWTVYWWSKRKYTSSLMFIGIILFLSWGIIWEQLAVEMYPEFWNTFWFIFLFLISFWVIVTSFYSFMEKPCRKINRPDGKIMGTWYDTILYATERKSS